MNDDRDDVIDDTTTERSFVAVAEESPERRSPSSRDQLRKQIMDEVNAFLASGGQIQQVEPLLRTDLPTKPSANYGDSIS